MLWSALILAAVAEAAPQRGGGGGGGAKGTSLIRFGCSQIVIDRIDPYVNCVAPAGFTSRLAKCD